jgi:hypothetical protein
MVESAARPAPLLPRPGARRRADERWKAWVGAYECKAPRSIGKIVTQAQAKAGGSPRIFPSLNLDCLFG